MTKTACFTARSVFACDAQGLYDWHSRPGALERLIPPWENTQVLSRTGGLDPGGEVVMRMHAGPIPYLWRAKHIENSPGALFRDMQAQGPFASWLHTHSFFDTPQGGELEDRIDYALPALALLPGVSKALIEPTLQRVFRYRHHTLQQDILLHQRLGLTPQRILVSGGSGVLGSALIPLLSTGGHEVWRLVRREPNRMRREIHWDPLKGHLNLAGLPDFDGVVHLAADNIGSGRWTASKKETVIESRVQGTQLLARSLAALDRPPKVLLSASAVGFYGNCQDCCMQEENQPGLEFISDVCARWERAAMPAQEAGIRTVLMRIGVVLTPRGGALQRLLATSVLGFSRAFGSGEQYISWISVNDLVSIILHALASPSLSGPVNIAAPHPVTNAAFMRTLAHVMKRPLLPALPAPLLRSIYGQMASEVLLGGCKVATCKLQESGYIFRHPHLEEALRHLLGRID